MMRALLAIALLTSCTMAPAVEALADGRAELGTVYRCTNAEAVNEWCWNGDDVELELEASASCRPTPRLAIDVCIYACPAPAHGCNAFDGCWCPRGSS